MPRIPRKKHTNLDHELTGGYYEEKTSWLTILLVTVGTLIVLVSLYDLFIGIDTEWLANLVS